MEDPIEGEKLIHTQIQMLALGLGRVEVGHLNSDFSQGGGIHQ